MKQIWNRIIVIICRLWFELYSAVCLCTSWPRMIETCDYNLNHCHVKTTHFQNVTFSELKKKTKQLGFVTMLKKKKLKQNQQLFFLSNVPGFESVRTKQIRYNVFISKIVDCVTFGQSPACFFANNPSLMLFFVFILFLRFWTAEQVPGDATGCCRLPQQCHYLPMPLGGSRCLSHPN